MCRPPQAPAASRRRRLPRLGEAAAKSARCRVRLAAWSARESAVGDRRRQEAGLSRPVRWSPSRIRIPALPEQICFARAADAVDSPVLFVAPPDPQLVGLTKELREIGKGFVVRHVEGARAFDKPRPPNLVRTLNTLGQCDDRSLRDPGRTCVDR